MADVSTQEGMAPCGVRVEEEVGVGLGVALDMTNQAEARMVAQAVCAATSIPAAPMEVEESVADGSHVSQPRVMLDNFL